MAQDLEAAPRVGAATFGDRLAEAVERKRSQLIVGLDPVIDLLPVELAGDAHLGRAEAAEAFGRFCRGIIDAVATYAVGVKPQLAFFEALGSDGMRAFEDVCAYARTAGLIVLADAKRGDIGSTSRAYATAYLEPRDGQPPLADAMTVSPYLGRDSVEPLIAACRREGAGIFCLVKTSNEGVADIQDLALSDGQPALAARRPAGRGVGRGSRRRARPLQRRGGRRGDPSARDRRGSQAAPAGRAPASRRRCPGREPGRCRARVHERAGERARGRIPLGPVRLPHDRGRLAIGGRRRGCAAQEPGLDDLGLVRDVDWRTEARRYALPVVFLLLVTAAVLIVRGAL